MVLMCLERVNRYDAVSINKLSQTNMGDFECSVNFVLSLNLNNLHRGP